MTGELEDRARGSLRESGRVLAALADPFAAAIAALSRRAAETLHGGGRILTCGNGGSAADAQHIAAELAGRFRLERPPLDVLALTTNPSVLTAISNDYGFEEVFARQVEAHGRHGDMVLLFTTSGTSANIIRALEAARKKAIWTVGFTGLGGAALAERCDTAFVVPSRDVPRIQEAHIALGHAFCECVEHLLFSPPGRVSGREAGDRSGRE